jgi:hypothetical protein
MWSDTASSTGGPDPLPSPGASDPGFALVILSRAITDQLTVEHSAPTWNRRHRLCHRAAASLRTSSVSSPARSHLIRGDSEKGQQSRAAQGSPALHVNVAIGVLPCASGARSTMWRRKRGNRSLGRRGRHARAPRSNGVRRLRPRRAQFAHAMAHEIGHLLLPYGHSEIPGRGWLVQSSAPTSRPVHAIPNIRGPTTPSGDNSMRPAMREAEASNRTISPV